MKTVTTITRLSHSRTLCESLRQEPSPDPFHASLEGEKENFWGMRGGSCRRAYPKPHKRTGDFVKTLTTITRLSHSRTLCESLRQEPSPDPFHASLEGEKENFWGMRGGSCRRAYPKPHKRTGNFVKTLTTITEHL